MCVKIPQRTHQKFGNGLNPLGVEDGVKGDLRTYVYGHSVIGMRAQICIWVNLQSSSSAYLYRRHRNHTGTEATQTPKPHRHSVIGMRAQICEVNLQSSSSAYF